MAKIGIDFGTTNSLLVSFDKKTNKFNYYSFSGINQPAPVSSTVWYHDNDVIVGSDAREAMYKYANAEGHHFERSIKMKLGKEKKEYIFGEPTEAYKIASVIISEIKTKASNMLGDSHLVELDNAIFTIPINFNGKQRADLRKAAQEAGIEVTTFLHEPFAAIIGYYFAKNSNGTVNDTLSQLNKLNNKYILTFDWGGGTLDITVVKVQENKMYEVGTAELSNMAGDKIDEDLANLIWHRFVNQTNNKYSDEFLEKLKHNEWGRLLSNAEKSKIELSSDTESEFYLDYITESEDIDELLTREDIRDVLNNTMDAAENKINEALKEAGVSALDISHVLLTGGTCNIPFVQERMRELFGHRIETVKDADLVIAQGAAVISEMGWLPFLTKDILVQLSDDSYYPIYEKNTPIAAEDSEPKVEEFICVDQRHKHAKVIFYEGNEQDPDKMLGMLNVPILGHELYGDEIVVEAKIDTNIILNVSAYDKLVLDPYDKEAWTIRKNTEFYKLCFGLDFTGDQDEE